VLKWEARSRAIAATGAAALKSSYLYNARAELILGYVGQLMILPDDVYRKERAFLRRILHIPTNTIDATSAFNLPLYRRPQIPQRTCQQISAILRAATTVVPGFASNMNDILNAAEEHLPIPARAKGNNWPGFLGIHLHSLPL
jgi:hypothetical protein